MTVTIPVKLKLSVDQTGLKQISKAMGGSFTGGMKSAYGGAGGDSSGAMGKLGKAFGTMGTVGLMAKGIGELNRSMKSMFKYSPAMAQSMKALETSFFMIMKPIGDFIGMILRPVAIGLMRWIIKNRELAAGIGAVVLGIAALKAVMIGKGIIGGITGGAAATGAVATGAAATIGASVSKAFSGAGAVLIGGIIGLELGKGVVGGLQSLGVWDPIRDATQGLRDQLNIIGNPFNWLGEKIYGTGDKPATADREKLQSLMRVVYGADLGKGGVVAEEGGFHETDYGMYLPEQNKWFGLVHGELQEINRIVVDSTQEQTNKLIGGKSSFIDNLFSFASNMRNSFNPESSGTSSIFDNLLSGANKIGEKLGITSQWVDTTGQATRKLGDYMEVAGTAVHTFGKDCLRATSMLTQYTKVNGEWVRSEFGAWGSKAKGGSVSAAQRAMAVGDSPKNWSKYAGKSLAKSREIAAGKQTGGMIGQDGWHYLHKGEVVNPAYRGGDTTNNTAPVVVNVYPQNSADISELARQISQHDFQNSMRF
jgi:hypothetical protein